MFGEQTFDGSRPERERAGKAAIHWLEAFKPKKTEKDELMR